MADEHNKAASLCADYPDFFGYAICNVREPGLEFALYKPVSQVSTDLMRIVNDDQLLDQALRIKVKDINAIETNLAAVA